MRMAELHIAALLHATGLTDIDSYCDRSLDMFNPAVFAKSMPTV